MTNVNTTLREKRVAEGLSQEELARRAGVSRQAYAAVETGRSVPSTEVALRLARALKATVEDLFSLAEGPAQTVDAVLAGGPGPSSEGTRVQLAQVGDRVLAKPLVGSSAARHTLVGAEGVLVRQGRGHALIRLLDEDALATASLVLVGCDPSVALLAADLRERGVRLLWSEEGSRDALATLDRGEAHVAGCHLLDGETGEYNLPWVKRLVSRPCTVVRFAAWRQGLIVAPGNPKGITGADDLGRPGLRIINRQPGSGSRMLLDRLLQRSGVPARRVRGYSQAVGGHLAVAEVVAAGLADAGVGVEAAARALGLGFVPLEEERYDLVVLNEFLGDAPVRLLLETLKRALVRRQIEALGGYDAAGIGTPVAG